MGRWGISLASFNGLVIGLSYHYIGNVVTHSVYSRKTAIANSAFYLLMNHRVALKCSASRPKHYCMTKKTTCTTGMATVGCTSALEGIDVMDPSQTRGTRA